MIGLAAGATVAFAVIVAADQVAGGPNAVWFGLVVVAGCVLLAWRDGHRL